MTLEEQVELEDDGKNFWIVADYRKNPDKNKPLVTLLPDYLRSVSFSDLFEYLYKDAQLDRNAKYIAYQFVGYKDKHLKFPKEERLAIKINSMYIQNPYAKLESKLGPYIIETEIVTKDSKIKKQVLAMIVDFKPYC